MEIRRYLFGQKTCYGLAAIFETKHTPCEDQKQPTGTNELDSTSATPSGPIELTVTIARLRCFEVIATEAYAKPDLGPFFENLLVISCILCLTWELRSQLFASSV